MITLSVCMIVKNEEDVLERCIAGIKEIADEIIVVDTGSNDATKQIAARFTDKVFDFEWIDDFSAARNYSFSKATQDYIMWLDADDVLSDENKKKMISLKKTADPAVDVFMLKYQMGFDKEGDPTVSYYRERIFKREAGFVWQDPIHEVITPQGEIRYLDIAVWHKKTHEANSHRNLQIYRNIINKGGKLTQRQLFYYARELKDAGEYQKAIEIFEKFLEEPDAWIENKKNAYQDMANCYFNLKEKEKGLKSLFLSFAHGIPRAETLCGIAECFMEDQDYPTAAYWYEQAKDQTPDEQNGGFCFPDCYGYIPNIQLCVCFCCGLVSVGVGKLAPFGVQLALAN